MGELAEMMQDGTLCESCGEYLGGDEFKVPLCCGPCSRERRAAGNYVQRLGKFWQDLGPVTDKTPRAAVKAKCPVCGKAVKATGLADHARDAHGDTNR